MPLQYTVKAGDKLAAIAAKNHTTAALLVSANHLGKSSIHNGMKLLIPGQQKVTSIALVAQTKAKAVSAQTYATKKGDTFYNISQRFAVVPQELANWNNLNLKVALIPGQKLMIKSIIPQLASSAPTLHLINYKVGQGDTLVKIAKKFNVPLADLQKTNASNLIKGLHLGLKLKVLVDGSQYSS